MDSVRCIVDTREFERTLRQYREISGRDMELCQWKKLADWAFRALRKLRAAPSAKDRLPAFPTKGGEGDWALVRWLADRQAAAGEPRRRLSEVSRKEKSARRKSAGFVKSLMLGAAKAAKSRAAVLQGTGIRAAASGTSAGKAVRAEVKSVYRYERGVTRAFRARDNAGIDRRVSAALDAACGEVIADMEKYMAKKLSKAGYGSYGQYLAARAVSAAEDLI